VEQRGAGEPEVGGIALALSGGAARSIAHVGALKVLVEAGIRVDAVAGTSGGGLIGVLFAAGYPVLDLERDARGLEWRRLAELRPHPLGILSTRKLGEFLERRIGRLEFSELRIPCAVVATDLTDGCKRVFDRGRVTPAVEASCAIPEFYRPTDLDGHTLVDGGVLEPLPVETVRAMPAAAGRPVVGVSVLQRRHAGEVPRHVWHLVGQICEAVQVELVRRSAPTADLIVEPQVGEFPYFSLENAPGLIAAGEEAMRRQLDRLRGLLASAPPVGA
jgi:NTE family protein